MEKALRHPDKKVRVSTHKPVLEIVLSDQRTKIETVVEHGMGIASTPYFHSVENISTLISFEDDPNWMSCKTCLDGNSKVKHEIISFTSVDTLYERISNPSQTLALIDGPHKQRIMMINMLQAINVPYIVEHDSESLPVDELNERLNISSSNKYFVYQYVKLNPETMLYTKHQFNNPDLYSLLFMRVNRRYAAHTKIENNVSISHNVDFEIGEMTVISSGTRIIGTGIVKFGEYCHIGHGVLINVGVGGHVIFGHNAHIGDRTVLDGASGITSGDNVVVGVASHLYSNITQGDSLAGYKTNLKKEIFLENDVTLVGQCLMNPITARRKSVALLGSVITSDMKENHVYEGHPAKDVTKKYGHPWEEINYIEKYNQFQTRLQEFAQLNLGRDISKIESCDQIPNVSNRNIGVTYFCITTRTYTKISSDLERDFLSWMISRGGRFVPHIEQLTSYVV